MENAPHLPAPPLPPTVTSNDTSSSGSSGSSGGTGHSGDEFAELFSTLRAGMRPANNSNNNQNSNDGTTSSGTNSLGSVAAAGPTPSSDALSLSPSASSNSNSNSNVISNRQTQIEKIGRCVRIAADRMQVDIVEYLITRGAYPAINMTNMSFNAQDCIIKALEQREWREEVCYPSLPPSKNTLVITFHLLLLL
jgi:hypothetical protein